MGTFGEVARTTMVRNAFRALTGDHWSTRLIAFSDDMDGLRKVPEGVPNPEMLTEDLHKPLTVVRDPFGTHDSFGAHNNARLRAFLDGFGFDYEFLSSTEQYRSGRFDATLLTLLDRFDAVQAIMLPTLGEERRATYPPSCPSARSQAMCCRCRPWSGMWRRGPSSLTTQPAGAPRFRSPAVM
jgi:lysyl-tRNA synthetase class 1